MSNHMPSKVCDEITYPYPNFNGCTVEVWEWINDFITHFIMRGCNYSSMPGLKLTILVKGAPGVRWTLSSIIEIPFRRWHSRNKSCHFHKGSSYCYLKTVYRGCRHDDVIKWKHFPCYWPFVWEFTGHRWIPLTKASDAGLWCFLWPAAE